MTALLDVDSLFYLSSYKLDSEESIEMLGLSQYDEQTRIVKLAEIAQDKVWEMIYSIFTDIEADANNIQIEEVEIYVTRCKESIRKKISPEYKSNRESNELVNCLRNMFIMTADAIYDDVYEADDLIAERAKELGIGKYVIITMDKDLNQIGGFIYNYYRKPSKKDEQGNVIEVYPRKGLSYVSPINGMKFLAKQMLMGDSGDMVKGLPKYGIKKAEKIIEPIESKFGLMRAVIAEYRKVYEDDYFDHLQQNYRLLFLGKM